MFQYPNGPPFESEAYSILTIPLIQEHIDSYLYYVRYKSLKTNPSQTPFQVFYDHVSAINRDT